MITVLHHIGTQKIETERLILRKFTIEDTQQMFDNWAKDPKNVTYLSWSAHKDITETQKIINEWINEYTNEKCYRWCITLKSTGEVIGGIDVVCLMEDCDCCEIGYVLSKKHWNNGIMTEALQAVLTYLFNNVGFHRIQLKHDIENPASGKVMANCGMKFEGILRESYKTSTGNWRDIAVYSILENELK